MRPGVRFLPEILEQCYLFKRVVNEYSLSKSGLSPEELYPGGSDDPDTTTADVYDYYIRVLESPNTKRLLFDARQAKAFDEANAVLKAQRELKIHPPFNQFYMEFTEPIVLRAQEPGHTDQTRAIVWTSAINDLTFYTGHGQEVETASVNQITMYFRPDENDSSRDTFVERSWIVTDDGRAVCRGFHARKSSEHIGNKGQIKKLQEFGVFDKIREEDHSELPDFVQDKDYFVAGSLLGMESRNQGWWEKAIYSYTNLIFWMFAYTMAKSIETVVIPYPRQMIRRYARENKKLPPEWHVVRVKPTFKKGQPEAVGESTGIHHSYRYDVIGHLRFLPNGSITWVDAHQRGLANDIYIPKTYKVDRNREIATKQMKEYLG